MAADQYLVAAAGHLESAANALKMEADQIRAEFMTFDRQVSHEITTKDAEMRSHTALAATSDDDEQRRHLLGEIQRLRGEIAKHKQELESKRKDMESRARSKEGEIQGLMSQVQSLRNKAASLK
jgi:predicted RNase H-like nuclease (RuvC/YqgF family)